MPVEEEDKERLDRPTISDSDNTRTAEASAHEISHLPNGVGVTQPAKVTIDACVLDELEKCRAELAELKGTNYSTSKEKYRIIHRVPRAETEKFDCWLDHPRWVYGELDKKALQGSLPVSNVENFAQRHPEVSFLVQRTYRVGHGTDNEDDLPTPSSESIYIVSDRLKSVCRKMYKLLPYPVSVLKGEEMVELKAPYLFIYHSRNALDDCAAKLEPRDSREWQPLVRYILEAQKLEYERADYLISQKQISKGYIQYLFKPQDHVVLRQGKVQLGFLSTTWPTSRSIDSHDFKHICRESGVDLSKFFDEKDLKAEDFRKSFGVWNLEAYCFSYLGVFIKKDRTLSVVEPGKGNQSFPISELNVYPLEFAEDDIQALLKKRGEVFWRCRTQQYVSYVSSEETDPATLMSDRYMIDFKTYLRLHHKDYAKPISSNADSELDPALANAEEPPKQPFLLLLPNEIKGYNLRTKSWVDLEVNRITEIKWNETAFDSLVIDTGIKELIRALVTNLVAAEKGTDLIGGKGNGLTMLLHGGPGTGKTFTAESVAEIAHKPLYRVTCGDIGTTPKEIETYLENVLHLGNIWNCVVLLDEADIFLEERSLYDVQRNALVSTFLRVLEYFNGILILTSNRVGRFDEAFRSRIMLALHYKPLTHDQRRQVWRNFFRRLKDLEESKVNLENLMRHVEDLADHVLNGREIRNIITIGRQLAIYRNQVLDFEILESVVDKTSLFDKYLLEVNEGQTGDAIARELGMR
ncbi:hypothetical protein PV08_04998 [Exophiala spinifera]|uniref:AAA+ ATPase domain-containing protein n=1 Tax=Exophiala spinifera TaxID=91928 RepID=A0A0D2BFM0_9EURO|nr:uncharacterized protein PV08_04998 [Exophiala spinifera]KIW17803.1 hypothetical protein PV08_04998 [Exophiala spinifera]